MMPGSWCHFGKKFCLLALRKSRNDTSAATLLSIHFYSNYHHPNFPAKSYRKYKEIQDKKYTFSSFRFLPDSSSTHPIHPLRSEKEKEKKIGLKNQTLQYDGGIKKD